MPLSSQETNIPEETLMTVVKPGLPTSADLHVLLPANQPKRKRSVTSDKVTRATYVWLGSPHPVLRSVTVLSLSLCEIKRCSLTM